MVVLKLLLKNKINIIFVILSFLSLQANILHFKKYIFNGKKDGDTLLVIGGIHGNEPGGYFAPSILIQHYKILKGNLIVIPNLNFDSDIRNIRGYYGDMNRKFAHISQKDPDYKIVRDVKRIILSKKVDLVLNLHDGHGFYRPKWQNVIFNPKAWGQALIIDQRNIKTPKYYNLEKICKKITTSINNSIFKKKHIFGIKNTKTKFHDEQMRLSLTYFAITHNKPALAIETSKNIKDLTKKVYYQLLTIEEFMKIMGIKYKRDFKLDEKTLKNILSLYGYVTINDRVKLDLNRVKNNLKYFPIKRSSNRFIFSHPLGAAIRSGRFYYVKIGNKNITKIKGEYFKFSKAHPVLKIKTDHKMIDITDALEASVNESFKIIAPKDIRVNVIGFTSRRYKNEANIWIKLKQIDKRYSIYKNSKVFRVEFYDKYNKYIKTVLISCNGA